eukprot:gnl/MRDRNA2_/MRDRNA2_105982_c0_seq1.p1 gnl/MRDRNA2_/MRDRNA2_105982_c0~~gnl/MRDRNA2_/MRDRNA2_105982_c0_seq1.p1  ORF type:complete len:1491 (+),score=316.30 gnl/MRDRNA2_/MRDRNA2_105982_c0_seq1:92-4564(+)
MNTYVLGFTIFDARGLQTEDSLPCDPFVVVECCGKRYQTETKIQKSAIVTWNENFIWPDIQLYPKEFDTAYVEFTVYARNWFTRNSVIGKASLQLSTINRRRAHLFAKKWLSLKQDNDPDLKGMINLTVFCLKPKEKAPSADEQEGGGDDEAEGDGAEDYEDLQKALLGGKVAPPDGKAHHVMISIHRVDDLSPIGMHYPNPFVTVEFCGNMVKTSKATDVKQYTFNETCKLPVMTPLFEETILLKLWHWQFMAADELLAQGMLSFSELRNQPLPPRWFNLYGWDTNEIPDISVISASGEFIEENFYKGRLLISGRVERLSSPEELDGANKGMAKTADEPAMQQTALLADVYEVCGAIGRECEVEISMGQEKMSSKFVYPSREEADAGSSSKLGHDAEAIAEDPTIFRYTQSQGRIDPLLVMTPEDPISQPDVFINVYTRGVLSGRTRIGYTRLHLSDFEKYEMGNPSTPKFYALRAMPYNSRQKMPASVLMTIEKHPSDDVLRHNRKNVRPMPYIVRAYVFMARSIKCESSPNFAIRVNCAGVSKETEAISNLRPCWMQNLDLRVILMSDHPKEPPTMEPITVTLVHKLGLFNSVDLGKAICDYKYMRRLNVMGKWEKYVLEPQWVKVRGGTYATLEVGQVLVTFELLHWKNKDLPELQPQKMWPIPEDQWDPREGFCKLKRCTLHFSLQGLRELRPQPNALTGGLTTSGVSKPVVKVFIKKFVKNPEQVEPASSTDTGDKLLQQGDDNETWWSSYEFAGQGLTPGLVPDGDKNNKEDVILSWTSSCWDVPGCMNFEMLQCQDMKIMLPEKPIFDPWMTVTVYEKGGIFGTTLSEIGSVQINMGEKLPCCWFLLQSLEETLASSLDAAALEKIHLSIEETIASIQAKDVYKEISDEERQKLLDEQRQLELEEMQNKNAADLVAEPVQEPEQVNSTALPRELRFLAQGGYLRSDEKVTIDLDELSLNMRKGHSFGEREGEDARKSGDGAGRGEVDGKLEDSDSKPFIHDFWYKNRPLLRNRDVISKEEDANTDWYFWPGVHGFVKFCFKISDGWTDGEEEEEDDEDDDDDDDEEKLELKRLARDKRRLLQTYQFDEDLDKYAFKEKALIKYYKAKEKVPSRVRVRLYFVKAICIFGKGTGFADPYLKFILGEDLEVSMRNMFKPETNTPEFYRVEERDINIPTQAKLQVFVNDYDAFEYNESLVGATTIDLEDRWQSAKWQKASDRGRVPIENRALWTPELPGASRGSLEMWVELIDSVRASDQKASELRPPPAIDIEVRIVIWTTKHVKLVENGEKTDVHMVCQLDCAEYMGEYDKSQPTDVHYGSDDGNAIFNWRIVYPRIRMPTKSCTLQILLYDYNLLTPLEYIGELNLDLKKYIEKVAKDMDMLTMNADLRFSSGAEEDPTANIGEVNLSMWVLTQGEADSAPVGIAREEPNEHPQLITPTEGRDWGSFLGGLFKLPSFGLLGKLAPIIVVVLAALIGLKQIGLL